MVCEGEHHIWHVQETSFKALVRYGMAAETSPGIYRITDTGRDEAKHWPR